MDGSDAMALPMVVMIPDLVYTYMEPMETATSNQHASRLTNDSPQGWWPQQQKNDQLSGAPSQISHYWAWKGVMPWPYPWL